MGTDREGRDKAPRLLFLSISRKKALCALSFTPRRVSSFPLELLLILGSPGGGQREYSQSNVVLVQATSIPYYNLFIVFFFYSNLMNNSFINDWDTKGLAPTSLTLIYQFEQLALLLILTHPA